MALAWLLLPLLLLQLFLARGCVALIGGQDASLRQFPSQALLQGSPANGLRQAAAGVLVHPEWVLTAAEAVSGYMSLTVTLGVVDKDSTEDSRQDIPALRMHLHPNWSEDKRRLLNMMQYDIALVKLEWPAKLNDWVQVAGLPANKSYSGHRVTVAGWGSHKTDTGVRNQNRLQWEESKTMSFLLCYWKRFVFSVETGSLRTSHVCADTKGTGPCFNDNGAPLMLVSEDGKQGVVVGLFTAPTIYFVSCDFNLPSVFTRVSSHLRWIASVSGLTPQ